MSEKPFKIAYYFGGYFIIETGVDLPWSMCNDLERAKIICEALNESVAREKVESEKHKA